MPKTILLVDDHPTMIAGYKQILLHNTLDHQLEFVIANDCESAYNIITNTINPTLFDFAIIDYSLPPYPEAKIAFGDDLVVLIKKHFPNTKTLIITSHFESVLLYNIYLKTKANGILIKTDVDDEELILAYNKIMDGETYFSKTAQKARTERLLAEGHFDAIDRQIITMLSLGNQIKTIAQIINSSEDTIKKRKSKIKDILGIDKGNDEDILRECRLLRLI